MKRYVIAAIILIFWAIPCFAGWQADLDELVKTGSVARRNKLIEKIADDAPGWQAVSNALRTIKFPDMPKWQIVEYTRTCIDLEDRPYIVYVPQSYDPAKPTPMFVYLHGGVSSDEIYGPREEYVRNNRFTRMCEEHGWIGLFPFGQAGATWWDDVGIENILGQIREVKTRYNVDDDRIYMSGFSDGGSASFLFAMILPTDFAAFIPLNGHMGVGSLDGDLPTYAPNFFNTPVYTVTTFNDGLYPSKKMRETIEMARNAGADMLYRELAGVHRFDYGDSEIPLIADFLERHPRDPFPPRIVWETGHKKYGRCRWFEITDIALEEPAKWHADHNTTLISDRITIGFISDENYQGDGVKVDNVLNNLSLAMRMDLRKDDIIIKANDVDIHTLDDLGKFKSTINRGDEVKIVVKRGNDRVALEGRLDEPKQYLIFKRTVPSAMARVSYMANQVELEASRVKSFKVYIHPAMFNMDENITIIVEGKTVFNKKLEPDIEYMLKDYIKNRDRKFIPVAEVKIDL
ncbi:MAG: PDZ domain-containing protein [candidate division Zixibacteria bacterium]|nr:PDZ domain-containing protein [candidate division Zixibacteria bacterium]